MSGHLYSLHHRVLISLAILCPICPDEARAEPITPRRLAGMDRSQLEAVFAGGTVDGMPVGYYRGRVLQMLDARLPRTRASMSNLFWKGKHFQTTGVMINQWLGFKAITAPISIGSSYQDGCGCIILDYPDGAPVFGGSRDEIREISPGLYLGRYLEKCPTPRVKGYFLLEKSR